MVKVIRYKLAAQSKGRNGFFTTSGIVLERWRRLDEDIVVITALTGKGKRSEAIQLRIPKGCATEVVQALIDLSKGK